MSDQNKYINGYIDNAVGMIHENVNLILQLKTQLRMANELVSEKDAIINNITFDLESNKNNNIERNTIITKLTNDITQLKEANESMSSKQSHMDTALNQISQMKAQIIQRDEKIVALEATIDQLKISNKNKTAINKVSKDKKTIQPPLATDDF